jgi:hypothetical protein
MGKDMIVFSGECRGWRRRQGAGDAPAARVVRPPEKSHQSGRRASANAQTGMDIARVYWRGRGRRGYTAALRHRILFR